MCVIVHATNNNWLIRIPPLFGADEGGNMLSSSLRKASKSSSASKPLLSDSLSSISSPYESLRRDTWSRKCKLFIGMIKRPGQQMNSRLKIVNFNRKNNKINKKSPSRIRIIVIIIFIVSMNKARKMNTSRTNNRKNHCIILLKFKI